MFTSFTNKMVCNAACFFFTIILLIRNVRTTHEGEDHQLDEIILYDDTDSSCSSGSRMSTGGAIFSHSSYNSLDLIVNNPTDCNYTLELPSGYNHMMLEFAFFDVDIRFESDSSCNTAFVEVFDGDIIIGSKFCEGLRPPVDGEERYFQSSYGNSLKIHVFTSGSQTAPKNVVVNFHAYFTAYNLVSEYQPEETIGNCTANDWDCENSDRCVPFEVTCDLDNIPNCGISDTSDESTEEPLECPVIIEEEINLIPLWVVLGLFGLLAPFMFYWCCWKPGYLPWWCAHCRRNDCCPHMCSCYTKKSRHLCRELCRIPGLRGCSCVCCSSKTGVVEESEKLQIIDTENPASDDRNSRQKNLGSGLSQNSNRSSDSSGVIRLSNVTIAGGPQGGGNENRPDYQGRNSKNDKSPSSDPALSDSSASLQHDNLRPVRSQRPSKFGESRVCNGPREDGIYPRVVDERSSAIYPNLVNPKDENSPNSSPFKGGYRPLNDPRTNQPKPFVNNSPRPFISSSNPKLVSQPDKSNNNPPRYSPNIPSVPEKYGGQPASNNGYPNPNYSPTARPGVYLPALPAKALDTKQDTSGYHVREGR